MDKRLQSGDQLDVCGESGPSRDCWGGVKPTYKASSALEAYATAYDTQWPQITFCDQFWRLPTLSQAMDRVKNMVSSDQNNLEKWDNRARVFFHEVMHLDSLMAAMLNSLVVGTIIDDLVIPYSTRSSTKTWLAYGPMKAKILRNYMQL